ncbi:fumarate reductase (CoM/CoB) subunit TfrB [Methanocaldococcus indicus]|uniref:fumarate reductase (CoM/CoB) subunit TfrB n=1 Tax=Methanocaldococcus indicus TaxID=213231 RepID=UPI003C6D4A1F
MINIKIKRFKDGKEWIEEYKVPENLTVLEALEYINKEYNADIAFRYSCRNCQCGSCSLTINNEPKLACVEKVKDGMLIEALKGFRVIRDLIVDRESYNKKLLNIRNFLIRKKYPEYIEKIDDNVVEKVKNLKSCIECLSCLSLCPARENSNYPGATIMRQLARFLEDVRDEEDREKIAFFENLFNCTTCHKCVEVCPMDIDIVKKAIEKLREYSFKKGLYLDNHLKVRENLLKYNRSVVKEDIPFLEEIDKEYFKAENEKFKVLFFTGCLVDYRLKNLAYETIKVLNAHNISVVVPKNQVCCLSPMLRVGQRDIANKLIEMNKRIFNEYKEKYNYKYIVTICAGCGSTLKNDYKLEDVRDITELINEVGFLKYKPLKMRVTYHHPCHLLRGQKIKDEPIKILKSIPKLEYVEIPAKCCGAGGGVRSGNPELSKIIGTKRKKDIMKLDVEGVITVCPFCEYQLKDILEDTNIKVYNIVSILSKVI